jgi:hypothetical protein
MRGGIAMFRSRRRISCLSLSELMRQFRIFALEASTAETSVKKQKISPLNENETVSGAESTSVKINFLGFCE